MWAEWGKYAIIKMIGIYSDVGGFWKENIQKRVMGNRVEKIITLSEWLIQEYGNKKAWKAGTDNQIKKVNIQKVLDVFGREGLLHQAKQLEEDPVLRKALGEGESENERKDYEILAEYGKEIEQEGISYANER